MGTRSDHMTHNFSDLSRCTTYTIANETLRLRYVALEAAIVALVKKHEWNGISVSTLAEKLNAAEDVVGDEVRQAIAHGEARWCREGGSEFLRPAFV
jgi:hypothetical protein